MGINLDSFDTLSEGILEVTISIHHPVNRDQSTYHRLLPPHHPLDRVSDSIHSFTTVLIAFRTCQFRLHPLHHHLLLPNVL